MIGDEMNRCRTGSQQFFVILLLAVFGMSLLPTFGSVQEEASPVASQMKAINKDFRELRRQLRDPEKKEGSLALIQSLMGHLREAQKGEPSKTATLPESERKEFLKSYRSLLDEVIGTVEKLEKAVKAGQMEQAQALLSELNDQKKTGHNRFQE
jgi:soluble cytochrome b562